MSCRDSLRHIILVARYDEVFSNFLRILNCVLNEIQSITIHELDVLLAKSVKRVRYSFHFSTFRK